MPHNNMITETSTTMTKLVPNEQLALLIIEQLRAVGLIPAVNEAVFLQKLANGTLKEIDWKSALESALPSPINTVR